MASSKHIVGSGGSLQVGPPVVLATPCTLQALRAWLEKIDIVSAGGEGTVTVTTTTSTITAA